jgi:hypothetical protein
MIPPRQSLETRTSAKSLRARAREDGVRLRVTAGGAIELGQRQRRAQFEAARSLLLRDRDCGQEGFFCRRRIGGVLLEQHFPADAMQLRLESAVSSMLARRQRLVEDFEGAIASPARASASASAILISPSKVIFCSSSKSAPRRRSAA